jgi:pyruvate, water dikinase
MAAARPPGEPACLARWGRWIREAILLFLEVIGLRTPRSSVSHDAQLAEFRLRHAAFRRLLDANDSFLRNVADFERMLDGHEPCTASIVRGLSVRMLADAQQLISSLNEIADDRHRGLLPPLGAIGMALKEIVDPESGDAEHQLVLELAAIDHRCAASVGTKIANLGEIRNRVGLPTPDGFGVTVRAYQELVQSSCISNSVNNAPCASTPEQPLERFRSLCADEIGKAKVPKEIEAAILAAYDRLVVRVGNDCKIAVRSSALGEDEDLSFAGQYETILNVERGGLVAAWRQVVASLHCRGADHYRRSHGIPVAHVAMPVGFVAMVPAIAAGVVFSRDPVRTDRGLVIVQVAPGLGTKVVDGSVIPETIEITLGESGTTIRRAGADLEVTKARGYPDEVTEDLELALESQRSLLSDSEAVTLARWSRKLEGHFGTPQDVEWAMDPERRLFVVQTRPLELLHYTTEERPPLQGARLLLGAGEVVCPGMGTGVAVHVNDDSDFEAFPEGGVLIIKRPSPKYVRLMSKAVAIVADTGSTTGHMASLAREFRIPTLLGTRDGTKLVQSGQVITVDAFGGYVYAGDVSRSLEAARPAEPASRQRCDFRTRFLLHRAAELIVPLHLTDPRAPEFRAECCTTLHDITRYVHERSYEEMFRIGESLDDFRSAAYYLDVFLPVDLYIIDLGGGVEGTARGNRIKLNQVSSRPLLALLKGMLHPKIPRWGARQIDLGGFASVVIQHALTSPEEERTFRDPSYALVSDRYANYTARVGYHFSIVDAYCGDTANKNYIHVLFRGGAADLLRRSRRARAIAEILREWGFSVEVVGDSTDGRIHKMPRDETANRIEHVGRLLQFMRQMDVAMTSETAVQQVKNAFLSGDYTLEHLDAPVRDHS